MKTVLILGANSAIAQASIPFLIKDNCEVILAGRRLPELKSIAENNASISAYHFDARDIGQHATFYASLTQKPDIVIYAAGVLSNYKALDEDLEDLKNVLEVNYTGAVSILNIVARDFKERKSGSIIGISSVAADRGRGANLLYCSAKAGFDSYLSGLRNHLYPFNVKVVTIRPGYVQTKMIRHMQPPNHLTAQPEQVGKLIAQSIHSKRNVRYIKGKWRLIMWIIKHIPETIFKRLKL